MLAPRIIKGFFAAVLIGFLFPRALFAMEFSPAILKLSGEPGQDLTAEILVKNDERVEMRYAVFVKDFYPSEGGVAQFTDAVLPAGISALTTLPYEGFLLPPGGQRAYRFRIRVPTDAHGKSFYGAVHFAAQPTGEASVRALGITGPLVFVTMPEQGIRAGEMRIEEMTELPRLAWAGEERVRVQVFNEGERIAEPQASVVLRPLFMGTVRRVPVFPEGMTVLPGERRAVEVSIPRFRGLVAMSLLAPGMAVGQAGFERVLLRVDWMLMLAVSAIVLGLIFGGGWIVRLFKRQ